MRGFFYSHGLSSVWVQDVFFPKVALPRELQESFF